MRQGRILTTHSGSLPRPRDLVDLILQRDAGQPGDTEVLDTRIREATSAGRLVVAPSVVWAKLQSLVDGARLASDGFR